MPRRRTNTIATLVPARGGALDPASLLTALRAASGAREIGDRIAFDAGDGRNIAVVVGPRAVRFAGVLDPTRSVDEEHGGWIHDDGANDVLEDLAFEIARPLLVATRGTLQLALSGETIEPDERCSACSNACFEWEKTCPRCGAEIHLRPVAPDDDDDRAGIAIVDRLLAGSHIELVSPSHRLRLAARIAAQLGFRVTAARLHQMLMDDPAVAEVYCDVDEIERALDAR